MGKKILYVLGTAGIFYLAVLYQSRALLAVSGAAVLLFFFFLCALIYAKQKLQYELLFFCHTKDSNLDDTETVAGIQVQNHSRIYLPRVEAKIRLEHMGNGRTQWVEVKGKIPAKSSVQLTGKLAKPEFGLWHAMCKHIKCYEWMEFFYLKKKAPAQTQLLIVPSSYETNIKIGIRTRLFLAGGEDYHPQFSGDDPSETLKLREYQKGDPLNRIHWKLSAKNEKLIVAEMSMPLGCNVVFFLDSEGTFQNQKKERVYWEVVHTISQELLVQECGHYLVWQEKGQEKLCRKAIRCWEDLYEFWSEISIFQMRQGAGPEQYAKAFPGEVYASWIVWSQKFEISSNGQFTEKIELEQARRQMMELEFSL